MIFLLFAITCSLAFGVLFKIAGLHDVDGLGLVSVNYVVAAIVVAFVLALGHNPAIRDADPKFLLLGTLTGLLFIGGFVLLALATRTAGMSLALSVMRVSVVIPFTYSWLYWKEEATVLQLIGLGIACCAFFLITRKPDRHRQSGSDRLEDPDAVLLSPSETFERPDQQAPNSKPSGRTIAASRNVSIAAVSLVLLFISGGLTDVSMKTYDELFESTYSTWEFMGLVFGTAATVGIVSLSFTRRFTRRVFTGRLVAMGVILGVVNVASVEFLLRAVEALSGTFVFPALNISVVIGAAIMGVVFWKERLSRSNRIGIGLAALALFLMQA